MEMVNVHLPEWTFDRKVFKRISANYNLNPNPNSNLNLNSSSNPNPKAQKRFRKNKMTSFFGQGSRYRWKYSNT